VPSFEGVALRLLALTYVSPDPAVPATFWGGLLGREAVPDDGGLLLPGSDTQVGLRFVRGEPARPDRTHLHLTSEHADQAAVVQQVLDAGGRLLDVGQLPEEDHVVCADPDGNALCVIEPGNSYLAGTGFLGELAGDGTRAVGVFWSEALGWPLVWDQDEETAIQSPSGGTKVAWGGPPVEPLHVPPAQWFELTAPDVDAETDRLRALGAVRGTGGALFDPDGNLVRLR
jgi:catechol 2,3-dioxygenase-like lactoylglutathione lyase family enzyme